MSEKILKITIHGDHTEDLIFAMDEIKKQIEDDYTSGIGANESGSFNYDISEKSDF